MTPHAPSLARAGALAGCVGILGNVVGVAVLGEIPAAYRPSTVVMWTEQVMASPWAATASGVAFTLGLVALAGWAVVLAWRLPSAAARAGGFTIAAGALLNAAGTMAPAVVAQHLAPACATFDGCVQAGAALLGLSLSLDAMFNVFLGLGLMCIAPALWRHVQTPRWLAWLAAVAGAASLPVGFQVVSDTGADLLAIAGPLWLAFVAITSVQLWRD